MAIQYKPTKQKKEKPVKVAKVAKAEKPLKIKTTVQKVKPSKPAKTPKASKELKPIKANKLIKTPKVEKVVKIDSLASSNKISTKQLVFAAVTMVVVLVIAIAAIVLVDLKQEHDNQIDTIIVSSFPKKLEYYEGDKLRTEGLKLQVVLNNGESYYVDASECEFSGFDSSKAVERQTITVTYQGVTCTYLIKIKELPKEAPILANIYIETLPMTEYRVGQFLSTVGGVLMVEYADGTYMRHNLINDDVHGFITDVETKAKVTDKPGTYELEIRYREGNITKTCTYTITVTE